MAIRRLKKKSDICIQFQLRSGEKAWVRRMQEDDLEAVYELECILFNDPWSFSNFRYEVVRSVVSWPLIAETDYEIVGYAVPWFVTDEMHLANIASSPLYQRQGIAAQLMTVMLDEAMRRSIRLVYLEVRPTNKAAITLYETFGFEKLGIRRRYYRNGEDAILMQRFLPKQNNSMFLSD